MRYKILSLKEKKQIEKRLKENFGVENVKGLIIQTGQEKLFLYTGNLNPKQLTDLISLTRVERIGIYFAKIVPGENSIRLSIEGSQILSNQIKKNTFELNNEQAEKWMQGSQLDLSTKEYGFLVMKHRDDFLGTGKASTEKIGNFIPKNRRLKPNVKLE